MNVIPRLYDIAAEHPAEFVDHETVQQASAQLLLCRHSNRLPIHIRNGSWEDLERFWRVQRGPVIEEIFHSVSLPENWRIRATNDHWWSKLLDGRGSLRALIFYRASVVDSRAYAVLAGRYAVKSESVLLPAAPLRRLRIRIVDTVEKRSIFVTDWIEKNEDILRAPIEFLDRNYPEHRNPFAYWPEEKK